MHELAAPLDVARPRRRHRRHRRRPGPHRQHLHDGGDRRRRRRRPGGQARQPRRLVGVRLGRRAGGRSASRSTCARAGRRGRREAGITFCFAPGLPPGLRHAAGAAARAGRPDDVQLPRPADQPGPARGPGRRCRRPADGADHGRGVRRARRRRRSCSAATTGSTSSPPRRRRRSGSSPAATVDASRRSTRRTSGSRRSAPDDLRGGDAAFNADVARRLLAGRAGPGARRRAAQRGRGARGLRHASRATRRWPTGCGPAWRGRPRRSTPARPGQAGRLAGPPLLFEPQVCSRRIVVFKPSLGSVDDGRSRLRAAGHSHTGLRALLLGPEAERALEVVPRSRSGTRCASPSTAPPAPC